MTKKCANFVWNQYGFQSDSMAIDCLIAITRNSVWMCAFLHSFLWSFYLVCWERNVARRHVCSPVIPFTIHKTHWHTYGNNNIKRPQISSNEFFMHAVRQQHTARCDTHRLNKRIRTSFEHTYTRTHARKRSVTMSEKGRRRANGKPYMSQCRHWRCFCRSYCCYCVIVAVAGGFRTRPKHSHNRRVHTQLVGHIYILYRFRHETHKHILNVKTMPNRMVRKTQILVCHSSYTIHHFHTAHNAISYINTFMCVCESQFQCNDLNVYLRLRLCFC